MIRSRRSKLLGLCALVIGLIAIVTGGLTQAETGAKWIIEEPTIGEESLIQASMDSASASLEFTTAGGTKVAFTCTGLTLEGSPKSGENGSISEGKAVFTGCETFLNGVVSKACLPKTNKGAFDVIQTNKFTGLLELHKLASEPYDDVALLVSVVKDAKGNPLMTTLELGEECSIGASVPITGSLVVAETTPSAALEEKVTHLIQEFPALKLLKALGQAAKISGTANVSLAGAHEGYLWSADPA